MSTEHDYLSTACHHDLHDRCRKECKFCATPCKCPCHGIHLHFTREELQMALRACILLDSQTTQNEPAMYNLLRKLERARPD